jgi:hypothetical protein
LIRGNLLKGTRTLIDRTKAFAGMPRCGARTRGEPRVIEGGAEWAGSAQKGDEKMELAITAGIAGIVSILLGIAALACQRAISATIPMNNANNAATRSRFTICR